MSTFFKYHCFVEDLAEGVHDFEANTIKIALTTDAKSPNAATDDELIDYSASEIDYGNVVTSPSANRVLDVTTSSQAGGVYRAIVADIDITATGGAIPTFRYILVYNDSAPNDELIGWYDYGANLDLSTGETLTLDFNQTTGMLSIT